MNKLRLTQSRTVRLATSATAVAATVLAAAGITAGRGSAAPALTAYMASPVRAAANVKRPKLAHGVLTVAGTDASDRVALRLRAGDPGTLEVDVGDDGSVE